MSCSGLNSLLGSHQRWARPLNFASSAGSRFNMERQYRPVGSAILQSVLPEACAGGQIGGVEQGERAGPDPRLPRNPYVADLVASDDMEQVRQRIVTGRMLERGEVDGDGVGLLAGYERTDFALQAERRSATQGRHAQGARSG